MRYAVGWLLLMVVLLASCTGEQALPPPGASEGAQITFWRADAPPIVAHINEMLTMSGQDFAIETEQIRVHVPFADAQGALWLDAPSGRYAAQSEQQLQLSGPIVIRGAIDSQPILGHAASATFIRDSQALILEEFWLCTPRYQMHVDRYLMPRTWGDAENLGEHITIEPTPMIWQGLLHLPQMVDQAKAEEAVDK